MSTHRIWRDGVFVDWQDATIHVMSHVVHYASSVFEGLRSSWRRRAPDTLPSMAKAAGNYLNSQLSKMEARLDNYAEGIMLDSFGYVAEGSGENLFIVRDGVVLTSPIASGILGGITRDSVIRIAATWDTRCRSR